MCRLLTSAALLCRFLAGAVLLCRFLTGAVLIRRSLTVAVLFAMLGCSRPGASDVAPGRHNAADKLRVFVSILPQVEIVQRVGGQHVAVEAFVGPGQSPHVFSASPRQMARLADARLFFSIGIDFERGVLPRIRDAFPQLNIVDGRAGVPLRSMAADSARGGQTSGLSEPEARATTQPAPVDDLPRNDTDRGHNHDHDHAAPDPHVWLDPLAVKQLAANVAAALATADPDHADAYARNLAAYQAELDELDAAIRARLAPHVGRTIVVYHPSYGYFADRYGLRQIAIEVDGKPPGGQSLRAVLGLARQIDARAIFYEPQQNPNAARAIARELGVEAVALDPLAPDLSANLRRMAERIAASLASEPP